MKNTKLVSLFLAVAINVTPGLALASKKEIKAVSVSEMRFDPQIKYIVRLKNSSTDLKSKGEDMRIVGDTLVLATQKGVIKRVPLSDVNYLVKSEGTYGGRGLGFGALGGLALGTAFGLPILLSDCPPKTDDCRMYHRVSGVIAMAGGTILGAAIGSAIGLATPKGQKYRIAPVAAFNGKETQVGLGVGGSF